MRNRAKCKLCNEIIESFYGYDYVQCKCGEIAVDGGPDSQRCLAKDWQNFLRIDDNDNVIIPKIVEKDKDEAEIAENPQNQAQNSPKLSKRDLIEMFEEMVKNIDKLPRHALNEPISHSDFCSYMMVLVAIFKSSKK